MSNTFGFVSEETYIDKMDAQNTFLAALVEAQGGSVKPTSWSQVQALVRAGIASKVFAIGDQLEMQKDGTTLVWDIIGFDHDTPTDSHMTHSMTIQLHDCINSYQFDEKEAFYYADAELPAGTYNLTVGEHTWVSSDVGKTVQFTLANAVPKGGQIKFNQSYNVSLIGATVSTYASGSATTAIETATMTQGTSGTSLGTIKNSINGNLNSMQRALLGSNNWENSAMRQYLNSDKSAGAFWTPKSNWDRYPSWNASLAGFMNGMDEDFLAVVGKAEKVTALNTVSDGGGSVTTTETFFLISRSEVYMGKENSIDEGDPYAYYEDFSTLSAPGTGADANRIKYRNGSAQYWWLRTLYTGSANRERSVSTDGSLNDYNAVSSHGVAPACNII